MNFKPSILVDHVNYIQNINLPSLQSLAGDDRWTNT